MSSRRVLKAAEAIREVVSMAILTDIKDPRVKNVTVTFVEVSADLRYAKVHVSVMADENKKQLCLKGLSSAAGYLQKKVGNRIETRYVPRLKFELDRGLEHSMIVTRILEEVLPAEKKDARGGEPGGPEMAEPEIAEAEMAGENVAESDSADYDSQSQPSEAEQESDDSGDIPGEPSNGREA